MINGPAGQTKYGSIEALHVSGSEVSPLLTWDSKMTTVVAIMGGVSDIIASKMKRDQVYQTFLDIVNQEWSQVFSELQGEDVPFALPKVRSPQGREDFITCRLNVYPEDFAWGVATAAY